MLGRAPPRTVWKQKTFKFQRFTRNTDRKNKSTLPITDFKISFETYRIIFAFFEHTIAADKFGKKIFSPKILIFCIFLVFWKKKLFRRRFFFPKPVFFFPGTENVQLLRPKRFGAENRRPRPPGVAVGRLTVRRLRAGLGGQEGLTSRCTPSRSRARIDWTGKRSTRETAAVAVHCVRGRRRRPSRGPAGPSSRATVRVCRRGYNGDNNFSFYYYPTTSRRGVATAGCTHVPPAGRRRPFRPSRAGRVSAFPGSVSAPRRNRALRCRAARTPEKCQLRRARRFYATV